MSTQKHMHTKDSYTYIETTRSYEFSEKQFQADAGLGACQACTVVVDTLTARYC